MIAVFLRPGAAQSISLVYLIISKKRSYRKRNTFANAVQRLQKTAIKKEEAVPTSPSSYKPESFSSLLMNTENVFTSDLAMGS